MKQVDALVEASKEEVKALSAPVTARWRTIRFRKPLPLTISPKVDMRIALIENAEFVDGSDKLLRLTLDLGGERQRLLRYSPGLPGSAGANWPPDGDGR